MKQKTQWTGKRLLALFLSVVMALSVMVLPAAAETSSTSTPTQPVQDNLVLWLDAENNTGTGTYDSTTTTWTNLAKTDQQIKLNGQKWGTNDDGAYLQFTNNYVILPDEVRQAIGGENFTVEFVMEDYTSKDSSNIINVMALTGDDAWIKSMTDANKKGGVVNDSFVFFVSQSNSTTTNTELKFRTCYYNNGSAPEWAYINKGGTTYARANGTALNGKTNTITFDHDGYSYWYLDGTVTNTGTMANNGESTISVDGFKIDGIWQETRKPQVVFGAAADVISGRSFNAKVKAIRVYKDTLTADEAKANAAYDQAHYYSDDASTANSLVPAGYVTDDLVLFLDSKNNTGNGYSASTTTWTNLANTSETATFLASSSTATNTYTWSENGLSVNGAVILPQSALEAVAGSNFTVEFLVDNYDATKHESVTRNLLCLIGPEGTVAGSGGGTWDDDFVAFQNSTTTNRDNAHKYCFDIKKKSVDNKSVAFGRVEVDASSINTCTNALAFDKTKSIVWYQDGTAKSTRTDNASADWKTDINTTNGTRLIFGAASGYMNNRAFSGQIKAIRVYSDTLTAAELAANAALDQTRYYGETVDYDQLAQDSWDAVVGKTANLGSSTTLAGIKSYVEGCMTNKAAANLSVTVTDAGSGKYTVTYVKKNGGDTVATHTLYVDCEYTLKMSNLSAEQQTALLNDVVKYKGADNNSITVSWNTDKSALTFSGTRATNPAPHLYFPVYTSGDAYVYETEVSFNSGAGNWSTMAFAAGGFTEHLQYAFWGSLKDDSTSTGAEFCRFYTPTSSGFATGHQNLKFSDVKNKLGDKWSEVYTENNGTYAVKDTLKLKVVVYNDVLYGFINGVQVLSAMVNGNLARDLNGVFGFNTAGASMNIHSVSVRPITEANKETELAGVDLVANPVDSYKVDLYEPETDVNTAPIVMQAASSTVSDVSSETKRPSAMLFDLKVVDGTLKAYPYRSGSNAVALGDFANLYKANQPKANVGVRISDSATATALAAWVKTEKVGNLWVISNDVEQLKTVTDSMSTVRGVVDFTGDTVRGPANIKYNFDTNSDGTVTAEEYHNDAKRTYTTKTFTKGEKSNVYANMKWADVYDLVFAEGYRTILIPESEATADEIYFLQGSLVYTIVESDAETDVDYYDLITTGANGVIVNDYAKYIDVLESDTFDVDGENILVRGGSIVGHRGDMGNAVKDTNSLPENSIEAIVSAAQSGASSVEFDMYLTTDGELVTNHNESVKGYFKYPDDYTGTRVSEDTPITKRSWKGDLEYLVSTYNENIHMQRLQDLYEAVDNEYPDLRLHHEIKDHRTETLNRTIELMDQYGLRDRSDMMSFNTDDIVYVESMGISAQYLSSVSKYSDENRAYNMELQYRGKNSTWHAQWTDVTDGSHSTEFLEEMKHFGQTAYPWATFDSTNGSWYQQGYQGFTTNAPHHTDDYIRALLNVTLAEDGTVSATAYTLAQKTQTGTAPAATGKFGGEGYQAITLPDYLKDWWITKGISDGKTSYTLSDGLEIVVLEGKDNVNVNGNVITKKDGAASGEATIAVRYKQTISGGSYYMYSQAVKIEAKEYSHTHDWNTEWSMNKTHHWHVCTASGCLDAAVSDRGEHVYDDENDSTCNTCGYVRAIAKVPGEYVSDGLVLFLDGVDNTATGYHDSAASSWVNLANIAQKVSIPDGTAHSGVKGTWGSNYLDLDGYIKLPDTVRETIASGEFTIEFVMDDYVGTTTDSKNIRNIMTLTGSDTWIAANSSANPTNGTQNDNFVIYQNNGQQDVNFKINSDSTGTRANVQAGTIGSATNSLTFKTGEKTVWYQNAAQKSTSKNTYAAAPSVDKWDGTTAQVVFGAAVDVVANRAFSGNVKAIRIYDRVLSTSELASNATADSTRYADSASKTDVTITGVTAASDLTYTGSKQTGYTGTPTSAYTGTYVVNYTGRNGTSYGPSTVAPTNAGDYTVTIAVPATDSAYTGSASVNFSIAPKAVTVTVDSKSMTQNGTLPTWTYQVSGLLNGDQLAQEPQFTCSADGKTAGTFDIVASGADAGSNYTVSYEKGTLTVNAASSGSSSSSSGSSSNTTSTTVKNPDGSTTTTTTNKKTGTVTETTRDTNGVTGTTVTDKNGTVTDVSANVPASAAKDGATVALPIDEVDPKDETEITVDVPKGGATVEIPVENPTPGTVVVIVNKDGSETIIPGSKVTENGIEVTLTEDATIKVIDNSKTFTDVPANAYFANAVNWAAARGITGGITATTFGPHQSCTRAQLVTFLWRAAGQPEAKSASGMTDVSADAYYNEAVAWAFENGIVGGYGNGIFGAGDTITRQQMAVILYRFAQATGLDTTQGGMAVREFSDYESIADYAVTAMQWAVNAGILRGNNGYLNPTAPCTRAQIVTMLYRLLGE